MKILSIFGTRPEAIKMAPLVKALQADPFFESRVCVTAQHREMLDQVLELFNIRPDFDLNLMESGQSLYGLTGRVLAGMEKVFHEWKPDLVLVHGDTTSSVASALAAYYGRITIAHVEAGLRTGNKYAPWPEEVNRRLTAVMTDLHFAPTSSARENLIKENIPVHKIHVTGNTVIDALHLVLKRLQDDATLKKEIIAKLPQFSQEKKIILITGHRRENFGAGLENICKAIATLAKRGDVELVYPMHLNPEVREPVNRILKGLENVRLLGALDYPAFIYLMSQAHIILTDSGGIQEEGPALGKPVLVMRDCTERPEVVEAGTAMLTGADYDCIVKGVTYLLNDRLAYERMASAQNPYGDGKATERIIDILERYRIAKYGV